MARDCWEECLTYEFQELVQLKDPNILSVFCVMANQKYDEVAVVKDGLLERKLYLISNFYFNQEQAFKQLSLPREFFGVKIPLRLELMTIEQNMHMRRRMVPGEKLEAQISWAIAIYLQPLIDKTGFDEKRVEEIEKVVRNMRIYETYALGFFILSKLNNYGISGLLLWYQNLIHKVRSMMRKLKKQG